MVWHFLLFINLFTSWTTVQNVCFLILYKSERCDLTCLYFLHWHKIFTAMWMFQLHPKYVFLKYFNFNIENCIYRKLITETTKLTKTFNHKYKLNFKSTFHLNPICKVSLVTQVNSNYLRAVIKFWLANPYSLENQCNLKIDLPNSFATWSSGEQISFFFFFFPTLKLINYRGKGRQVPQRLIALYATQMQASSNQNYTDKLISTMLQLLCCAPAIIPCLSPINIYFQIFIRSLI